MLLEEGLALLFGQLLKRHDGLLPDGGLVEGGEDFEGRNQDVALGRIAAALAQLEQLLGHLHEELVIVVHFVDYFDQVRYEFVPHAVVSWVDQHVPSTLAMAEILEAALSLRVGLSLLSSSM